MVSHNYKGDWSGVIVTKCRNRYRRIFKTLYLSEPFRENGLFKSISHDCDDIVTRGREGWEGEREENMEGTHLEQVTRAPVASSYHCGVYCPTSLLPLPPPGKERVSQHYIGSFILSNFIFLSNFLVLQ